MKLSIRGSLPVVLLEEFGARGREREKDQQQNQINIISFPIPAEWCCCDTYHNDNTYTRMQPTY